MMKSRFLLVAACAVLLAAGLAAAQEKKGAARWANLPPEELMRRFDKDGDGVLTAEEVGRPRIFRQLDADGDGKVTLDELKEFSKRQRTAGKGTAAYDGAAAEKTGPRTFPQLQYTKDFTSGTKDADGNWMHGTETMRFVAHGGKLYASQGFWMDTPYAKDKGERPWTGSQILVKESAGSPWKHEKSFGMSVRVDALESFTFTTDGEGRKLEKPVTVLCATPGDANQEGGKFASVWTRDDSTGEWSRSTVVELPRRASIRSLGTHIDGETGIHHIFAGVTEGRIHRGVYDPEAPGRLRWIAEPELTGLGRPMRFCECSGTLYASAGTEKVKDGEVRGGLYKRVDGKEPKWELVWRWEHIELERGDEANLLRGVTAVKMPDGREVMIGTHRGGVYRIDPKENHKVTQELDIKKYFAGVWGISVYRGPALTAYNRCVPFTNTANGEDVLLLGTWVKHPDYPEPPHTGAYFLIRRPDAAYGHQRIYDFDNPTEKGKEIESTRTIAISPFPEDKGRVLYFGGYDCARRESHNTSWIYRGTIGEVGKPHNAILFSWDGLDRSVFEELLAEKKLPNALSLIREGSYHEADVVGCISLTKPSHAMMLTGLGTDDTRVVSNKKFQPIPEGYTVFERLQKHFGGKENIRTFFVAGKVAHVGGRGPEEAKEWLKQKKKQDERRRRRAGREIPEGADDTDENQTEGEPFYLTRRHIDVFDVEQRTAEETGPLCLEYLGQFKEPRFFAFLHFSDPDHAGHKHGRDSKEYREAAIECDMWLGKVIEWLKARGLYEKTAIYVTTDHGFDKGKTSHNRAPHSWLVTNDKAVNRGGAVVDVPVTIMARMGIDVSKLEPELAGEPLCLPAVLSCPGK